MARKQTIDAILGLCSKKLGGNTSMMSLAQKQM